MSLTQNSENEFHTLLQDCLCDLLRITFCNRYKSISSCYSNMILYKFDGVQWIFLHKGDIQKSFEAMINDLIDQLNYAISSPSVECNKTLFKTVCKNIKNFR
jgi:hypothetical protein